MINLCDTPNELPPPRPAFTVFFQRDTIVGDDFAPGVLQRLPYQELLAGEESSRRVGIQFLAVITHVRWIVFFLSMRSNAWRTTTPSVVCAHHLSGCTFTYPD